MARKTLLNESEIRRFMKLANMGPVGADRLESLYPGMREEEEMDAEFPPVEGGDELDAEMGAPEEEIPMDDVAPAPEAGGEEPMVSLADFVMALEQAVEEVTGQPTTADLDADVEGEEGAPLEGGDELDVEMSDEPMPPSPGGGMGDEPDFSMQEHIVNKVAKRVAARLVNENKKVRITEELTERIFKRLAQK